MQDKKNKPPKPTTNKPQPQMPSSLCLKSQPTEVSSKMERTKSPFYWMSYFRWSWEAFLVSVALELIQTVLGLRKLALILLRLLIFPQICSPRVIHTNYTLAQYDSYQGRFEGSPLFTFDFTVTNFSFLIQYHFNCLKSVVSETQNIQWSDQEERSPAPFIYMYIDISKLAQNKADSSLGVH